MYAIRNNHAQKFIEAPGRRTPELFDTLKGASRRLAMMKQRAQCAEVDANVLEIVEIEFRWRSVTTHA